MESNRERKNNNSDVNGGHVMTHQTLPDKYCINQHIGTEDRSTEFKNGPGFIRYGFRENVAKYVCGFVNSQQNGKLLIGVNDKGDVTGYNCTHREEDNIRRDVDEAVKDLVPAIFPEDYSVKFVPVTDEDGNLIGDNKVIGIIVNGGLINKKDVLYHNKQGVFVRRDGSIQELKAADIQEWDRRKYQPEIDKLKKDNQNYINEVRQLNKKLEQKNVELKRREEALTKQSAENDDLKETIRHRLEQNKAQEEKIIELKRIAEQQKEELRKMDEASDRHSELNNVSDEASQHQLEQDGAQGNNQINERFDKLEEMLTKSKVCIIS